MSGASSIVTGSDGSTVVADDTSKITTDGDLGAVGTHVARLVALLPPWFPSAAPGLTAILSGPGYVLSFIYQTLQYARMQLRIRSAYGGWLDMISYDLYGYNLPRGAMADAQFKAAILAALFPVANTRSAIITNVTTLTGLAPLVWYPWNPSDMGGYGTGLMGYGNANANYGSYAMNGQVFVIAYRPRDGIHVATNAQIYAAVAASLSAGITAWTELQ